MGLYERPPLLAIVGRLDVTERRDEVIENFAWHHDGISVATHILSYLDYPPACVLLQVEEEGLPIC